MSEETQKKVTLFDFISDISTNKVYLYNEDTKTVYSPFMVNRGLAQHIDTILLADEVNKMPNLSKQMQHDFLFHSVDAKKRYGKWAKAVDEDKLIVVLQSKYNVNKEVAIEYMKLLDVDQIEYLKKLTKGGRT